MGNFQRDYTTGEAAKICRCSQQTIIRCFDKGEIQGYHVPGSRFRRIPRDNLYEYLIDNNLPIDNFPEEDIPKNSLEHRAKKKK